MNWEEKLLSLLKLNDKPSKQILIKLGVELAARTPHVYIKERVTRCLLNAVEEEYTNFQALEILRSLPNIKEDRSLVFDLELLKCKLYFLHGDFVAARNALTTARTASVAIYVPPSKQADLDFQCGCMHAEERDYKTALSYFYEAFDTYRSLDNPKASRSLKHMVLCKIMMQQGDEVDALLMKHAMYYSDMEDIRAVAGAQSKRSLKGLEQAFSVYKEQLTTDILISKHLSILHDNVLETNLLKALEPFSRVEVSHLAELVGVSISTVQSKLCQLILDKKLQGALNDEDCLIIFGDTPNDNVYMNAISTFNSIGNVVDNLFSRTTKLCT